MGRVVVTGKIPTAALDTLRAQGHDIDAWEGEGKQPREQLLDQVRGAEGIITLLSERVDAELLDAAGPQLRIVANAAAGTDNVDVDACAARTVVVTNTPGVLTDATADIALALMLMATRRLGEGERLLRAEVAWSWGMDFMLGRGLRGRTLGIVGLGEIGRATARRARAFGMSIAYTGRSEASPSVVEELSARRLSFDELLEASDVVSLHVPHTEDTHHLISAQQLELLGATSYLINTARGPIVDEAALVKALENGVIAGAGLDVYEHEPQVHPGLLTLENVVLLPHLGSATVETRLAMAALAADNVEAVLAGRVQIGRAS